MERAWDTQSGDEAESQHRTPVASCTRPVNEVAARPRGLGTDSTTDLFYTRALKKRTDGIGEMSQCNRRTRTHKEILALQRSFENDMSV